ncbi:hypothetical protein QTG56_25175 (plasmid) [Rossellomorea sp. AcN35-11]|nr:hypothetical protein [Rossellomorea aquimaris]WJV31927.1 hypothetical protein QTG56_25175 [Rossellomorea sp. AcN35-11]
MKKYVVKWNNNQKEFKEPQGAIEFAESKSNEGFNSYVWISINGVLNSEPFFTSEWDLY